MSESNPFKIGDQMLIMESHEQVIRNSLGHMQHQRFVERFWEKDARLWRRQEGDPSVVGAMGWLHVAETMKGRIQELESFAQEIENAGFERVVLAGMGGSSLAPLVLSQVLSQNAPAMKGEPRADKLIPGHGGPETAHTPPREENSQNGAKEENRRNGPNRALKFSVLDSTDPETVLRIQREGPIEKCLFIIASKSGSTAEPNAFDDYFYNEVAKVKANPGENFVAITDPGTQMEQIAKDRNFRRAFLNFPDIGGRFSALSYFGMLPAALMGIDLDTLLGRAIEVIEENGGLSETTQEERLQHSILNTQDSTTSQDPRPKTQDHLGPAFVLGAAIGELALLGKDKLTFLMPPEYESLGLWLEQLIAESTGKEGKGILPVAGEKPGPPSEYGDDRVFVYLRPEHENTNPLEVRIGPLRDEGRPIVRININDPYDIAREFMRWEIATAVAGSIIGINPFDQPNVQEAKDVTKQILAQVEQEGKLPVQTPTKIFDGIEVYGAISADNVEDAICNFLAETQPGDFVTIMAYLTEIPEMTHALAGLQYHIRDCCHRATTKGYGPRFLHSTGQFHKGGPNKGHFIQLTKDDQEDAPLPGRSYTFGMFRNAQALGDRETLEKHGRRVIRFHLGDNPLHGVRELTRAVEARPTVVKV